MNFLVTGAAGFIGQHLTQALCRAGHVVYGLDIAPMDSLATSLSCLRPLRVDITDAAAMQAAAADLRNVGADIHACLHLAAVASPPIAARDPARAWLTNVLGTHNVLQLARAVGIPRVVFFSSAHVYGISPKYMPTDERHPLALYDMYTTTKILGEELCRLFYENHGISYCALRLWNVYGPGQSPDYFIGAKLAQVKTGRLTIRNADVTKDWIHVQDVVRVIVGTTFNQYVGPLNIGTGMETSLQTIVDTIGRAFGISVETEQAAGDGSPSRMCCDWRRAAAVLGWQPEITFADGLAALIKEHL